jgi:hypothetical protein
LGGTRAAEITDKAASKIEEHTAILRTEPSTAISP